MLSLETFESRSTIGIRITVRFTNMTWIRSGAAISSSVECIHPVIFGVVRIITEIPTVVLRVEMFDVEARN